MKFQSIDIEGTGLDTTICETIQFAAIIEETSNLLPYEECPKFIRYIKHPLYHCEAYAAQLNNEIFKVLSGENKEFDHLICNHYEFVDQYVEFLKQNGFVPDSHGYYHLTFAGKNLQGYDIPMLRRLPKWDRFIKVRHRVIDPSILYVDWKNDDVVPNLSTCKKRAGLSEMIKHLGEADAWDVIETLRPFYSKTLFNS